MDFRPITVCREDVVDGVSDDGHSCALALASLRLFDRVDYLSVDYTHIELGSRSADGKWSSKDYRLTLPEHATQFVNDFDGGIITEETIPDDYMLSVLPIKAEVWSARAGWVPVALAKVYREFVTP